MNGVAKLRNELTEATERVDRFILGKMTDDETDTYFSGDKSQYNTDLELLISQTRKVVIGLGWYKTEGD